MPSSGANRYEREPRVRVQNRIESPRNPGRRSASSLQQQQQRQRCSSWRFRFPALACAAHRASSMRVTSSTRRRIPVEAPLKGGTLCRLTSLSVDPFRNDLRPALLWKGHWSPMRIDRMRHSETCCTSMFNQRSGQCVGSTKNYVKVGHREISPLQSDIFLHLEAKLF